MKRAIFLLASMITGLGLFAQTLVYTPELKSPADDAVNRMPDVILSWYAVAGSLNLQYQVQCDTSALFNSPLLIDVTQTLLTGYQTHNLRFNTTYYWRVRAIDGTTSSWSEIWSFTVLNTMELSKPTNNNTNQDPNVNLEWKNTVGGASNPVSGIAYYDWQADTSANFNSPLLIEGTVNGTVFRAATQFLNFGTNYKWRVRPRHASSTGAWCDPFNFSVVNVVTLNAPANNAANQMLNALLKWKAINGILGYEFQIALDQTFNIQVYSGETVEIQVNADFLLFGNDYWWRVRARHQNDTTQWGGPNKFTTINTVILKTPANNAQNVSQNPTLTWTEQTGIEGYELQIATDLGFGDIFYDVKPEATVSSMKITKKMAYNTDYYWRMRAFSDGTIMADTTQWSTPWKFTVEGPQGINDPQNRLFSVYPNPASGKFYLKVSLKESMDVRYTVLDLIGKTVLDNVLSLNAGENIREISLENLPKGIYIIRLSLDGETVNQKLVVE